MIKYIWKISTKELENTSMPIVRINILGITELQAF